MVKKAKKFILRGTVQGVFFRQFINENANKLILKGYARNLPNGDVEILIEGDHTNMDIFDKMLRKGPEHANIRDIQTEEKKWTGEFKDFKILRF